jgi:cobalt/nickel transport system permease protein
MHIPDGFLSPPVWTSLTGAAAVATGISVTRCKSTLEAEKAPLLGMTAAFIFAAQMLNFPIGGGTSGHFMGGVLAAALLGPAAGFLVLLTVLIVQCLMFADGGITALGANTINMGLISSVLGYGIYYLLNKMTADKIPLVMAGVASWFSIVLTATACSLELALSETIPLGVVLPAMLITHAFIGIGEALITAMALGLILSVRPDILVCRRQEVLE